MARGEAELGIQLISEIVSVAGAELLGPLPAELQAMTVISAGIVTTASEPDAARVLLEYLTSPAAEAVIKATGMEPGSWKVCPIRRPFDLETTQVLVPITTGGKLGVIFRPFRYRDRGELCQLPSMGLSLHSGSPAFSPDRLTTWRSLGRRMGSIYSDWISAAEDRAGANAALPDAPLPYVQQAHWIPADDGDGGRKVGKSLYAFSAHDDASSKCPAKMRNAVPACIRNISGSRGLTALRARSARFRTSGSPRKV